MAVRFRPFDPDFLADPYPTYARLRDESPIHRVRFGPLQAGRLLWRITRQRFRESEEGIGSLVGGL